MTINTPDPQEWETSPVGDDEELPDITGEDDSTVQEGYGDEAWESGGEPEDYDPEETEEE
jgi:hypothetical protein